MEAAEPLPEPGAPARCTYCGGVIGVYEPVIQVLEDVAWTTSRAAEPSLSADSPGLLYHAVCYELAQRGNGSGARRSDAQHSPD